jgi:hypothetical protein
MSSARRAGISIVVASLVGQGCVTSPLPPSRYYVVSADTSAAHSVGDEAGLRVLDPRASEALRPGLTVAFFPPDLCRGELSAATPTATPEATDMANYCGVLISALETSVADRYSVVSWQTIKGPDPFERAAARNVDIIFEVDSMGLSQLGRDATSQLRLDFYQQSTANDRSVLNLGPEQLPNVAGRCKVGVEQQLADRSASMVGSFTGAIKAVEVSSGQALVYYQRTLTDDTSTSDHETLDVYYEARPIAGAPAYNGLQQAGAAATGVGFVGAIIAGTLRGVVYTGKLDAADRNRQPETTIASASLVAGLIVLAGGVTLLVLGNRKARRSVQQVPFQPAADVLCVQPVTPPWLASPPTVEGPPQGGSSYSFTAVQTAQRDVARERENRLRKLLIDDFTAELAQLDAAAPAPAP